MKSDSRDKASGWGYPCRSGTPGRAGRETKIVETEPPTASSFYRASM